MRGLLFKQKIYKTELIATYKSSHFRIAKKKHELKI